MISNSPIKLNPRQIKPSFPPNYQYPPRQRSFVTESVHNCRFFRKSFYEMEAPGREGVVTLPDLKKFMQRVSLKVSTSSLRERFSRCDVAASGEIIFDDFGQIAQQLLFDRGIFADSFADYAAAGDENAVGLTEFQRFLKNVQGEEEEEEEDGAKERVAARMTAYLHDSSRLVQEPSFHTSEFMDWLFSKENQVRT